MTEDRVGGHPVLDDQPEADPIADLYDRALTTGWRRDGVCAQYEGTQDTWFPDDGARNTNDYRQQAAFAAKLCLMCPVMDLCRAASFAGREQFGVWGAIDEMTRDDVMRQGDDATRALLDEAVRHAAALADEARTGERAAAA